MSSNGLGEEERPELDPSDGTLRNRRCEEPELPNDISGWSGRRRGAEAGGPRTDLLPDICAPDGCLRTVDFRIVGGAGEEGCSGASLRSILRNASSVEKMEDGFRDFTVALRGTTDLTVSNTHSSSSDLGEKSCSVSW